jgi:radical SAM protein with 4Fe4S-binding SPASM domain
MIDLTALLSTSGLQDDGLRYGDACRVSPHGVRPGAGPVVVWNCTGRCNLRCLHCYSDASAGEGEGALTTEEGLALIDELAALRVPVLLFSGGEPLMRADLPALIERAARRNIRVALSTNGTLIRAETARRLHGLGVRYAGISLDGGEEAHDRFRGRRGAFREALAGLRRCLAAGVKAGVRVTLHRGNRQELDALFRLVEWEGIPRICFYHLVGAGRGRSLAPWELDHREKREALDRIIAWTRRLLERGRSTEVLTVDNHADGPYLYLKLEEEDPGQAGRVLAMLRRNGGNRSGMAIVAIDARGDVHPDQFSRGITLGNVRSEPFGSIWSRGAGSILQKLRDRKPLLTGRCGACRFLEVCNGNLRARAYAATGDLWAPDPACYLTDAETAGQPIAGQNGPAERAIAGRAS